MVRTLSMKDCLMSTKSWSRVGFVFALTCSLGHAEWLRAQSSFGEPLPGLSETELSRFAAGKAAFEEVEGVADGVGPVFNRESCVACHDRQATGGGSDILSTRIGTRVEGFFDPLINRGGPVIQAAAIVGRDDYQYLGEEIPAEATIVAGRRTPQTFGLGHVDAVPDAYLWLLAIKQQIASPRTAGWPNLVSDLRDGGTRVGRFGWKAGIASLRDFSGDAYKEEMGITTPGWLSDADGRKIDDENPPQGDASLLEYNPVASPNEADIEDVILFTDFMTFLSPPPRGTITQGVRQGEKVFLRIGCADCHTPTLMTAFHESPALRFRTFAPYSDFLLHDMGTLGDGIEQGTAIGSEMRTAPLWGLRTQPAFLHDGRAATIEEAISQHQGQGQGARERFQNLNANDRGRLLEFLNSL
jgi:CxxC motif-containing protein (DUF1111 family)